MPFARGFGPLELIIILVIVMMIFGVGKLPQVGQAMGKAFREFRKSQHDEMEEKVKPDAAQTSEESKDTAQKSVTH